MLDKPTRNISKPENKGIKKLSLKKNLNIICEFSSRIVCKLTMLSSSIPLTAPIKA